MPDTPPAVVWADDLDPCRRPPQTDPPLHAERRAAEVFDRVAGGTRTSRPRPSGRWWGYAVGLGLLVTAGAVGWWQLDLALLHIPTVVLAVGGLALVVKTLMGYR